MRLISFDIFRTLGFPNTQVIKPEHIFKYKTELSQADWVLFPEYWQLNALVYGLGCRVFPSEASYRIGHNKIEMTRAFEMVVPEHVPLTLIEPNGPLQREKILQVMTMPFVVKIPKASMGEGVWLVENQADWLRYCERTDVLYVQEYLPIDRDIRVVVVGDQVVTAYWRHQAAQGFYNNVARGGRIEQGPVPESAIALALRIASTLGVNHAGFDIAMVGEHPYVLEFNRLFGNQGVMQSGKLRETILSYLQAYELPEDPDHPTRPPRLPIAV